MHLKVKLSLPDDLQAPAQPETSSAPPKRSTLKLKIALLARILIVAVVAVGFFASPGEATIPLSVTYQVGEKLVYDATISVEMKAYGGPSESPQTGLNPGKLSTNATMVTDVLSFDGQTYTLNQTTTIDLLGRTQSISFTQMINKTGFSTFMINSPTDTSFYTTGSNSVLKSLLDKPDVKVGESVQVPMEGFNGNLTLSFGGIKDLTVPAGTYKVYKVVISGDNLALDTQIPEGIGNAGIKISTSMSGEMYIEYGTGRQIQYSVQSIASSSAASGVSMSFDTTCEMVLSKHIPATE